MTSAHASLLAAVLVLTAACSTPEATEAVAQASRVGLVDTSWRLTELDGRILTNPEGTAAIWLQLQAQNSRLVGFSGCNRMFGAYRLDGDALKFAQVGSTRMACEGEDVMQLEASYLRMFDAVESWQITGETLQLLDAQGRVLATFVGSSATR
jgi:heat shock protein HslJ